jgi:hypothetical protein
MSSSYNLTCKGTWRQVFTCLRPRSPYPPLHTIYIRVPVFMARYVMVLRSATSLRGALEGVGPENPDFFGPKKQQVQLRRRRCLLCEE